jgi:predicted dinucleotide-binding enzyme
MRIAVIGMGNVGRVLGRRWAEARHQVTFCVRNPDDPKTRAAMAWIVLARHRGLGRDFALDVVKRPTR